MHFLEHSTTTRRRDVPKRKNDVYVVFGRFKAFYDQNHDLVWLMVLKTAVQGV